MSDVITLRSSVAQLADDGSDGEKIATMVIRKARIEHLLSGAASTVLERAVGIHEWIVIDHALASVSVQAEQKIGCGRPRGGVSEAARELPLPKYMTESARRQLVQRYVRIARISPRGMGEARFQKLDDNQTALLAIAKEQTEEAQVEVARTWRFRNAGAGAVRDLEEYVVSGLAVLKKEERQRLDRLMKLVAARFRVFVLHTNAADDQY